MCENTSGTRTHMTEMCHTPVEMCGEGRRKPRAGRVIGGHHDNVATDADDAPYDLRRHLEDTSRELRAARSDLPDCVTPISAAHPPAASAATERTKNQRFRGLVTLSAYSSHVDVMRHRRVPAICAINSISSRSDPRALVLLSGPELSTTLVVLPLGHIQGDAIAGLDTVFCIAGLARKRRSRAAQQDCGPDSRVYLHFRSKAARDSWLQVLHQYKVPITGWDPAPAPDDCEFLRPCSTFGSSKIADRHKIGFGQRQDDRDSDSGSQGMQDPVLGGMRGRRLPLNNALPLVVWLPE